MTFSSGEPFKLDASGVVKAQLRELLRKAKKKGFLPPMIEAFQRIENRLRTGPHDAGEPLYTLGPPRIAMRIIADSPLVVEYGVKEEQRVVLVRCFRSMVDLDS